MRLSQTSAPEGVVREALYVLGQTLSVQPLHRRRDCGVERANN